MNNFYFIPIGLLIGVIGTLIGAGGGFLLMPFLLLLFKDESPQHLTFISMLTIFFNSLSGSVSYLFMKRVELQTAILFSLIIVPGSIAGTIITAYIDRSKYNYLFGIFLTLIVIFILTFKKENITVNFLKFQKKCYIKDSSQNEYRFSYNLPLGGFITFLTGFFSPIFGIGGGIIHVPLMIRLLCFPPHIATATSHFVLMVSSLLSVIIHFSMKPDLSILPISFFLIVGVIPGAWLGAKLSNKVKGEHLLYIVSIALLLVAIRIIFLKV